MLTEELKVTVADLMPIKGISISLAGESIPYRISERLHAALKDAAANRAVMISALLQELRNEIHAQK